MTETPDTAPTVGPPIEREGGAWKRFVRDVDDLLRGRFTQSHDLHQGKLDLPTRNLTLACLILGAGYGFFMGLYTLRERGLEGVLQTVASMVKVPLLFLLTLAVTLPSLYVFSAITRSRLRFKQTVRLLLVAIAVNLTLLASFGTVTAFFTFSTKSYPFIQLLNFLFFAISGLVGLSFLRRALNQVYTAELAAAPAAASPPPPPPASTVPEVDEDGYEVVTAAPPARRARTHEVDVSGRIFRIWIVIYGVVGAQMGWLLRPFIGAPDKPFTLFREHHKNIFLALIRILRKLFVE